MGKQKDWHFNINSYWVTQLPHIPRIDRHMQVSKMALLRTRITFFHKWWKKYGWVLFSTFVGQRHYGKVSVGSLMDIYVIWGIYSVNSFGRSKLKYLKNTEYFSNGTRRNCKINSRRKRIYCQWYCIFYFAFWMFNASGWLAFFCLWEMDILLLDDRNCIAIHAYFS